MQRRPYFIAFLVAALSTVHGGYGFFDSSLPVWGLFRHFDRFDYTLIDADGRSLQLRDYVQRRAYVTCDHRQVYLIGRWLVDSGNARAPVWGRTSAWNSFGPPTTSEFTIQLVNGQAILAPANRKAGL